MLRRDPIAVNDPESPPEGRLIAREMSTRMTLRGVSGGGRDAPRVTST